MKSFTLPKSRLDVTFSAKLHHPFPELGDATTLSLDMPAPWSWESYRTGHDPVIDAILRSASQ